MFMGFKKVLKIKALSEQIFSLNSLKKAQEIRRRQPRKERRFAKAVERRKNIIDRKKLQIIKCNEIKKV